MASLSLVRFLLVLLLAAGGLAPARAATSSTAVTPAPALEVSRKLKVDAPYLRLPLLQRSDGRKAGVERLTVESKGAMVRFVHLEIAPPDQSPDFWYSYDLSEYMGQEITLRFKSVDPGVLDRLVLNGTELRSPTSYRGPHRPRFHFSPRLGWMNDVNGTYYHDGLYHLFYQANPTTAGRSTGFDMHWGHSVSRDLVHWEEWPIALHPDASGNCYSGTALLPQRALPEIATASSTPSPVLFFTGTQPNAQHLATSPDGGRTWHRYPGNPVVPSGNRDPKVFWHDASQHYIMLLYVDPTASTPEGYGIFRSENLVTWERVGHIPHWYECPEFLPMTSAVTKKPVWVLYGYYRTAMKPGPGDVSLPSAYQLGEFDGKSFTPLTLPRAAHQGPNFYGALTFMHAPREEIIMMAWARGTQFPQEPFNQCATVPLRLSLRALQGVDVLHFEPIDALKTLRGAPLLETRAMPTEEANRRLEIIPKEAGVDATLRIRPDFSNPLRIQVRSLVWEYDPKTRRLTFANKTVVLAPSPTLDIRILIDRGIVECFWNQGQAAYAAGSLHTDVGPSLSVENAGTSIMESLSVYPVSDIWASGNAQKLTSHESQRQRAPNNARDVQARSDSRD